MKLADILKGNHEYRDGEYVPKPYVHQEYPKWVDGKIVKTEEEHRALMPEAFETHKVRKTKVVSE